ncbi:molybdopterin-dependent oxidoreductase [Shewanella sp. D64]|uniref:molybdopterin-dependent oxidoreductase n=1 Tax=unclassified Shewanella TaxID=196818 RepID=UPI0022BA6001|nr:MULTISPECIES: molybdopterin-dependent oxidoreductase [unclassified Shewanella]MEC4727148.1 molybdopterin-dependent oxidoreductase [Shewanella sp. D64]MEC4739235.1 molybdopterin-dependent oxidoreductase [Shewanella sp. E94]WBJ95575.1 molybdopterin-dependent oxidoreductase [Shewanella sp. MTB7]
MDRRIFLKNVGIAGAAAGLSGLVPGIVNAKNYGARNDLLIKRQGKVVYHSCLRNCADRCLLKFYVQNGRMTYVEGAAEQPKTGSCPCVKGLTYVQYTYSPDRILHPMERVGVKGSGQWRRISWDEAYSKIATRFKKIIAEDGANAILPYSYSGNYGAIGMYAASERFWNKVNARELDRYVCAYSGTYGVFSALGTSDGPDPEDSIYSDLYISHGWNEAATNVHVLKYINKARDNNCKVIVINPIRTPLASQADLHIQLKPGTDVHFIAAAMKCMVDNNLHDMDFINRHTVDFDAVVEQLKTVSIEKSLQICQVSEEDLLKFIELYSTAKLAHWRLGYGIVRNYTGGRIARAACLLHAVGGHYAKIGNGLTYDNMQAWGGGNHDKIRAKHLRTDHDVEHTNITELAKALDPVNPTSYGKPSQLVKAMLFYNGNPAAMAPEAQKVLEYMQRDDLFVVGFDFNMHDSMDMCDIILPSSTQFETSDIIGSYGFYDVQVCEQVIEPLGESKPNLTFFSGLAKAMGYTDPEFDATSDELIRQFLETDSPFFEGITYDRLMKDKFVKVVDQRPYFGSAKYNTTSGKLEFKSQYMVDKGFHPVLDLGLVEDWMGEKERKLPFRMVSPALIQRMNCEFYNVKYIRNFPAYTVTIHPEDAKEQGIADNDQVRVYNHRGEVFLTAVLSSQVSRGVVLTVKNNLRRFNPNGSKTCTNIITTDRLADLGGCSAYHSTNVAIEKA